MRLPDGWAVVRCSRVTAGTPLSIRDDWQASVAGPVVGYARAVAPLDAGSATREAHPAHRSLTARHELRLLVR